MARKGFSTVFDPETTACARGVDMGCSMKHSRNIAIRVKGMKVDDAKEFLEEVIALKTAVPMVVRHQKVHHKRGQGFGPGGYPVKAAGMFLKILKNAENNAEYKGLDKEDLRIVHASAYLGQTFPGFRPRAHGRASPHNTETTNLEIILAKDERLDERDAKKKEAGGRRHRRTPKTGEAAEPKGDAPAPAAKPAAAKPAAKAPAKTGSASGSKPAAPKGKAEAKPAAKAESDKAGAEKPAKKAASGEKKTPKKEA